MSASRTRPQDRLPRSPWAGRRSLKSFVGFLQGPHHRRYRRLWRQAPGRCRSTATPTRTRSPSRCTTPLTATPGTWLLRSQSPSTANLTVPIEDPGMWGNDPHNQARPHHPTSKPTPPKVLLPPLRGQAQAELFAGFGRVRRWCTAVAPGWTTHPQMHRARRSFEHGHVGRIVLAAGGAFRGCGERFAGLSQSNQAERGERCRAPSTARRSRRRSGPPRVFRTALFVFPMLRPAVSGSRCGPREACDTRDLSEAASDCNVVQSSAQYPPSPFFRVG